MEWNEGSKFSESALALLYHKASIFRLHMAYLLIVFTVTYLHRSKNLKIDESLTTEWNRAHSQQTPANWAG